MALTLTEGEKYTTTEIDRVVIDLLTKDSPILPRLGFVSILGNSLTYDMITTDAGASFYSVGDTWVESTPAITQDTAVLKILGGDADVDNFLLKTRSNKIDMKGTVLANKVKAIQNKFMDTFWYGSATTDTKSFNGLHNLMTSTTYNTVQEATANGDGGAMSVAKMRETIDLVKNGAPEIIAMPPAGRRLLSTYLDSVGEKFQSGVDRFGKQVAQFDGIPIFKDDHLLITESTTDAGAYESSGDDDQFSVFFLKFDEDAVCGVHSGDGIQIEPLGTLETKDATRWRIKWYVALMFQDLRSSAKYIGCLSGSAAEA